METRANKSLENGRNDPQKILLEFFLGKAINRSPTGGKMMKKTMRKIILLEDETICPDAMSVNDRRWR